MGHPSSPTRWVELLQSWAARTKALSRPRSISTISQRCVSPGAFSATAGQNFTTFCEAMMRRTRDWEARDGRSMRFEIVSRQDGKITDSQRGLASLVSNGTGTVTLERKDRAFSLPTGTLFPTRETFEILNAAVGGERSLSRTMF